MKDKYKTMLWVLLLTGLLLASCKSETPVDELPVDQETEGTEGTEGIVETEEPGGSSELPPGQEASVTGEVTLYLPNETADGFLTSSMILEDTPEAILAQLAAEQAIPEGVTVLRFEKEQGLLDLSGEYAEGLQSAGTAGEQLMIGCVVNTFLEHYGMDSLFLYSDGKVIETGHNTYEEAFGFIELE